MFFLQFKLVNICLRCIPCKLTKKEKQLIKFQQPLFIYKKVLTFDEGYALHAMIINFILLINKPYTLIIKKKTVLVVYVNYYEQKKP